MSAARRAFRESLRALVVSMAWVGLAITSGHSAPRPLSANLTFPSRPSEIGLPPLRTFTAQDYKAQPQNWAIVQDLRGVIYVGNGDGILEFDGQRWRLIPVANQTIVRSLAVDAKGRVYVGAVGEIGYLEVDHAGRTQYRSLRGRVPEGDRDFADVWNTLSTPDGIVFSSAARLIRIGRERAEIWKPAGAFQYAFVVDERLFVREQGRGLLELAEGDLRLLPGGERFADEKIFAMVQGDSFESKSAQPILIGTRTQGLFVFDGNQFTALRTEVDAALQHDLLYRAIRLRDGRVALGTIQGGIYLLDARGHLSQHLAKAHGLPDDGVYGMFQDREHGLWLGMERGLARIEVDSPLSRFDERSGLIGTVYTVHRHRDRVYAGTTQGAFVLDPGSAAGFRRVTGIEAQTWAFQSVGDRLLVANHQGLYELQDSVARRISSNDSTAMAVSSSASHVGCVYVGLLSGLSATKLDDPHSSNCALFGVHEEVRTLLEDSDGWLWAGTLASGVLRVRVAGTSATAAAGEPEVERFGLPDGLPSLNRNWVYSIDGEPRFATRSGIFRFDSTRRRFEPDPRFSDLFPQPKAVSSLEEAPGVGIWMYAKDSLTGIEEPGLAIRGAGGRHTWDSGPLRALRGGTAEGMHRIHRDADGVIWLAGATGLVRYDPSVVKKPAPAPKALLRRLSSGGGVVYDGNGVPVRVPAIEHADNTLRFEYAAPTFDEMSHNRFQVFLEGNDRGWSEWSTENYRDYGNLFEGNYRFRVRAQDLSGTMGNAAHFDFLILPPWYRTAWAYFAYALAAGGLGWAVMRSRSRRFLRQQRALEALVHARTADLQRAYTEIERISFTDPLTGLRNRRFLTSSLTSADGESAATRTAFILVDVDHFKSVNDSYGHAAGDTILSGLAVILRNHCRDGEHAVRWGGEEFLLRIQVVDEEDALNRATHLRCQLAEVEHRIADGTTLRRTCSLGIACHPFVRDCWGELSWEDVVAVADAALYMAKRGGRNRCVCIAAVPPLPTDFKRRMSDVEGLEASGAIAVHWA